MTRRNRRPRFNGADDDHAPTEQWFSELHTSPEDGTTVQFTGASIIGLPVDVTAIAIAAEPGICGIHGVPRPCGICDGTSAAAPLAGYRPAPPSFPALPPAAEPLPEWERDLLAEQARQMALPVLTPVEITMSPAIGDDLRLPHVWCEMGGCINFHRDPGSLGERDARGRARAAGWRTDALGRLACPPCQQTRPDYRTPQPLTWQHPGIPRRWHEHGTLPSAETQSRLEAEAAYARRVSREHPDWARAMAGATHRTAAS